MISSNDCNGISRTLIELNFESLPSWIQSSELCESQRANGDIIVCLERFSQFDLNIQTIDDLGQIFGLFQYWGVKSEIPFEVFDFMFLTYPECISVMDSCEHFSVYNNVMVEYRIILDCFNSALIDFENGIDWVEIQYRNSCAVLKCALILNNIHLLRYIFGHREVSLLNGIHIPRSTALDLVLLASKYVSISTLDYISDYCQLWHAGCVRLAMKFNTLEFVNHLIENGCPWRDCSLNELNLFMDPTISFDDLKNILMTTNIDINIQNTEGVSALHNAAEKNCIRCVRLLLDHGADFRILTRYANSPLHVAARKNCVAVVQMLLKAGVANSTNVSHCELVDAVNTKNETALYLASKYGYEEVVDILLSYGANVNIRDNNEESPLYAVCKYRYLNIRNSTFESEVRLHHSIAEKLIINKADVNFNTSDGDNALIAAFDNGFIDLINLLLDNNVYLDDVVADNSYLWIAIYAAAYSSSNEYLEPLIADEFIGCDINVVNSMNMTPLYAAVYSNKINAVKALIGFDADVNFMCLEDKTALDLAMESRNTEVVKILTRSDLETDANYFRVYNNMVDDEYLSRLLNPVLFYDSVDFYYKKYLNGSRQWIHNEVIKWLNNDPSKALYKKKVFWLQAGPGLYCSIEQ